MRAAIIATILAFSTPVSALDNVQTVDPCQTKATTITFQPGPVHIIFHSLERGIKVSNSCMASDLGTRIVGGQVARKDGTCEITFVVVGVPTQYTFGLRNDDFIVHTYSLHITSNNKE